MYQAFPGHLQLGGANETFTITLTRGEAALAVACGEGNNDDDLMIAL